MTEPTAAPVYSPDGRYQWINDQWQPVAGGPVQPGGTDGLAIGSLVLSLLWFGGLASIAAVVLGHVSRSRARREGREPSGLALAGLILGYIGLVGLPLLLAAIAIPVFLNQRAIGHDAQAKSELRNVATLEETYYTDQNTYTTDEHALYGHVTATDIDLHIISANSDGYCLSAKASGGSTTFYYDSQNGGLSTIPCS